MGDHKEKTGTRQLVQSAVKGGTVKRVAETGQLVTVQTEKGTSRSGPMTQAAVSEASSKRHEALKRLADR